MFQDFFDGIRSYAQAIRIISEMRLWKHLFAPGLLSLLLATVIGTTAWGLSDNLGNLLISWYPFDWGRQFLTSFSFWVGGLLIGLLGLILFKHLVMVLVSPFMSPLSQKVEEKITGRQTTYKGFEMGRAINEILRGLRIAFRNIFRELFFVALLFLFGFVPVIGMVATAGIFLVQAYYAGFGNMDYTLERHFSVRGSVSFVRRNKAFATGNGTVFILLLMTGIGFLFAPPLATVAATVETIKRMDLQDIHEEEDLV